MLGVERCGVVFVVLLCEFACCVMCGVCGGMHGVLCMLYVVCCGVFCFCMVLSAVLFYYYITIGCDVCVWCVVDCVVLCIVLCVVCVVQWLYVLYVLVWDVYYYVWCVVYVVCCGWYNTICVQQHAMHSTQHTAYNTRHA